MKIERDQSGKIEETNVDTVIALSNGVKFSVRIHRRTKRRLQEEFRKQGRPKFFRYKTFATGVYILIKDFANKADDIVIDTEYVGNDRLIKNLIMDFVKSAETKNILKQQISFKQIGKKSPAHILAISVFRGKKKASRIIQYDEIRKLAIKKPR